MIYPCISSSLDSETLLMVVVTLKISRTAGHICSIEINKKVCSFMYKNAHAYRYYILQ